MRLAVNGDCFEKYVSNALVKLSDRSFIKVVKSEKIDRLENSTVVISIEEEQKETM